MTKGQYPTIQRGLGNLTPDLWRRMMVMLEAFEQKNQDERSMRSKGGSPIFLASLIKAECLIANRYKYSWVQVRLLENNTVETVVGGKSSTGTNDEWDFAAINLLEILNTSIRTSAGVSMEGQYPSGWTMQAMGGGSADAGEEITLGGVIVVMHQVGSRYVFSNVNEHDGTCATSALAVTDGISNPTIPVGATYGYIYIGTDGDPKFMDKDENIVTFDTT